MATAKTQKSKTSRAGTTRGANAKSSTRSAPHKKGASASSSPTSRRGTTSTGARRGPGRPPKSETMQG
jgi:hypothetical protein